MYQWGWYIYIQIFIPGSVFSLRHLPLWASRSPSHSESGRLLIFHSFQGVHLSMSESILTLPIAQKSWASLDSILVAEIREILLNSPNPWQQIKAVPKLVEQVVINVLQMVRSTASSHPIRYQILQQELDVATPGEEYFTVCMKTLRALSEERDIFPESFQCANIIKKGELPFSGGGSAVSARCLILFMSLNKPFSYMQDVWKGEMDGRPVCLKVLRIFTSRNQVEKILKVCLVSVRIKFRPTKVDNSNYAEKLLYGGNYATRTFFLFLVSIPRISCLAIALYLRGCRMEALSAS